MVKQFLFFIKLMLVIITLSTCNSNISVKQPNIVLLFVDDLGWADLGYRNPVFETPNIDQLASESVDFQQAYIASPSCSPSRAALLTGKHPARLKIVRHIPHGQAHGADEYGRHSEEYHFWEKDPVKFPSRNWLELEHTSYAEALNKLGYYNAFFGKWHLGEEDYYPINQGFDLQVGVTNWGNPASYYPPYFRKSDVLADETEEYLTGKLTDEAIDFINGYNEDKPFMLSLWYYNVHSPHEGRKDLVAHFESKGLEGKKAHYAAMLYSVDESVGRIRMGLEEKGISRETIIIFLGDQGSYFETDLLHGGKRFDALYEGGARVPFIVHWPGVSEEGASNKSVVQSTDVFPTLIEIAGGSTDEYEELDGTSLIEVIKTNGILQRGEAIFGYRAYEDLYASVRDGDWKLLAYRSGLQKLYNIKDDTREENDLAESRHVIRDSLTQQLIEWEIEMDVDVYSGFQ